ncbi:MAG: helix-turn-helix transcriptional regulator [Acholeplasma sp.]|nr:helix-turn-helix transcriptional regulator [Acholeplasma sp.]
MEIAKLLMFMDNLRHERKVSQENFLYDIVSQRQYYRYLNGESLPPFDIVIELSKRLDMTFDRLINQFQQASEKETLTVKAFFNAVISRQDELAIQLFEQFKSEKLIEQYNQRFILIGKSLLDFNRERLPKHQLITVLKDSIDFNKIMKSSYLQDLELYILGLIMQYSDQDRKSILKRILTLNSQNKLYTSGNRFYISQVYFWVLKNLGVEKRFDELISLSDDAISYALSEHSYYLLEYFYYYKALAYYKKKAFDLFEETLLKTLSVLWILPKQAQKHFEEMILKDTSIHIYDFYQSKFREKY